MPGQGRPRIVGLALAYALATCDVGRGQPIHHAATGQPASPVAETQTARQTADLEAVCLVGEEGWAVGDHGTILHTSDGGATWRPQTSPVAMRLLGVSFLDARRGWAVGGEFLPGIDASRGIVLRTDDGGRTWTTDRRQILPRLKGVHFVDAERGWVWGEPSGIYPSGVLTTSDGGRSFSPVDWSPDAVPTTTTGWLTGATPHRGSLALLGRDGRVGLLDSGRLRPLAVVEGEDATFALAATGDAALLTAGDHGAIHRLPLRDVAPADRSERSPDSNTNWRGACALSSHLWLVGDPGSVVLHSPDNGASWESLSTEHSWPLTAIAFGDLQHGCAVGAGGAILNTSDGGRTWRPARPGVAQADALVIAVEPGAVPWDVVDSGGPREIVVWCAANRVAADDCGSAGNRGERLRDALSGCGARSAGVHGLPLWPAAAQADGSPAIAVWNSLATEGAVEQLAARIVRLAAAWRPAALCGPAPDDASASGLVGRATEEAWRRLTAETPAGSAHDVPSRRPRRWCVAVVDQREVAQVDRSEVVVARALVPGSNTPRITYQVRAGDSVGLTGDPALALAAGTVGASASHDLAKRVRHVQAVRSFAERRAGGAELATPLEAMLGDLDDAEQRALLTQLARGDTPDALPAARMLDERFPEHPLSPASAWRLWRMASGFELACVTRSATTGAARVQQAADVDRGQIAQSGTSLHIDDAPAALATESQRLRLRLQRVYPQVAFEPAARVSLAAWQRRQGRADEARRELRAALASRPDDAWSRWLRAELWLDAPRGACPVAAATCRLDAARPRLDGRLDDATWQSLAPLAVTSPWHDDAARTTEAFVTADAENLYLAVRCARAPAIAYASATTTRERDADLRPFDRVTWWIDVDRDLSDAFELTIDHRGWGAERLTTGADWDPRWYIAARLDEEFWIAETALPWSELRLKRPATTDTWACRIVRVAPGAGVQVWPADEHPADPGPQAGLVRFAVIGEDAEPGRFQPQDARPIPLPGETDAKLPGEVDRTEVP